MLKEIAFFFESHLNNSKYYSTRKMQLYSCHDDNIATTMAFLGNAIEMPGFGASLHFHLYHDETIGHSIKVQVYYIYYIYLYIRYLTII